MAGHPLVGTWIVDRNPADPTEMPTTNVFTADGGLIDPSVGAAGVWTATGERTADFTLIAIFAEGRPAIGLRSAAAPLPRPRVGRGRRRGRHRDHHGLSDACGPRRHRPESDGGGRLPLPPPEGRTAERCRATPAGFPAWAPSSATPTP